MMNGDVLAAYNEALEPLYDGVTDYAKWQLFLERFNVLCEARDTSIIVISPTYRKAFYVLTTDHDPAITQDYIDSSLTAATFFNEIPAPVPTTINEMMSEQRFLESPLYRDYFSRVDVRYLLCQDVVRSRHVNVRMTSKRSSAQGPFGPEQKQLYSLMVGHVRRAITLREQHYFQSFMRDFYDTTIDKMEVGYLMLDRNGRITLANNFAESLLRDQVGLVNKGGVLRLAAGAKGPDVRSIVQHMVAQHEAGGKVSRSEGFRIDDAAGDPVLSVVVKPLFEVQQVHYGPAVLLYLTDCRLDNVQIESSIFKQVYGFTRSESRLATLLARGESLAEAADHLNVSIHTVRTHVRGIYGKLGINKQYKVAALLNKSAARLL